MQFAIELQNLVSAQPFYLIGHDKNNKVKKQRDKPVSANKSCFFECKIYSILQNKQNSLNSCFIIEQTIKLNKV